MAQLTVKASQWAARLRPLRRRLAPDGSRAHMLLRRLLLGRANRPNPVHGPEQITLLLPVESVDSPRILDTVSSLLEQTEPRWQLLLVDDPFMSPETEAPNIPADRRIERFAAADAGRAASLNAGLAKASGTFVAVLEAGDQLAPEALQTMLSEALRLQADVVYCDEVTLAEAGPPGDVFAKPDWSPELLLSFPYTGRLCMLRREMVQSFGGWNARAAAAEDYALVLAAARAGAAIRRVDRTLYRRYRRHITQVCTSPEAIEARRIALAEHLSALGTVADVAPDEGPAGLRLRWPIPHPPLVSIVIATRDRIELLDQCIQSIVNRTRYPRYEIVIVDNDSAEEASLKYFEQTPHRLVRVPGPFNFSAINNAGAREARGEYLLFLNNDTEVVAPEWLDAMLEWAQLPDIGCVGAKLLFADGRIQHAGVTLHDGLAFHPRYGQRTTDKMWVESEIVRNFSAVTAACLLLQRSIFEEVGGFDESFPVAYNDVVLCVRVMQKGYRNLYTPYAVLYHHESSSRPPGVKLSENEHLQQSVGQLLWSDPYCPADQRATPSRPDSLQRFPSHARRQWGRALARASAVWSSVGSRRTSLRHADIAASIDPAGSEAAAQAASAVRWLDSVEIAEYRRIALFMHPNAHRTFRVTVPRRGRFLAWAALMPDVWTKNSGGVRFRVTVQIDGRAHQTSSWVIDPGAIPSHRRWRRVSVSLSAAAAREIDLTLETTLPEGAAPAHAWAIWGDPVILERKSVGEIVRRQAGVIKAIGLKAAVRRYGRVLRGQPVDAAHYDSWFRRHRDAGRDADRIRRSIETFDYRPCISLITPVFNTDPRWLRRLVDSVRAQTYPYWEHCLADDGSTREETRTLLAAIEQEDSRIKVVRLRQNAGISAASNAALAQATGEFIALVDHDDELAQDALFEVSRLLNTDRDADVVYTDEDKLEFDGTHVEPYFKPDWSPEYSAIDDVRWAPQRISARARVECRRLSFRVRRIAGLRPGAARDLTDRPRASHRKDSVPLAEDPGFSGR